VKRVVVEPSGHRLLNHGDTAMLQVAVRRLRETWPDASIGVITADADGLERHVPGVEPVPASGRYELIDDSAPLPSRRDRMLAAVQAVEGDVTAAERALGVPLGESARAYLGVLAGADVFLVSGRGGLCDAFHRESAALLDEIEAATDMGIPVAMMGQGLGPIEDPFLLDRAREVLPKVGLLALREGRASLPLARSLGVPDERVVVTGDDALELVVELGATRRADAGLGVNLRVADYAAVGRDDVERIAPILRSVARGLATELVGVPISAYPDEADEMPIERLTGVRGLAPVDDPAEAIRRAGRCRVVVTGSYHAALFALGQGVPVVGLARSGYYVDKLRGLAERFGTGMTVVELDARDLEREIEGAVRAWWAAPAGELESLTGVARRQVDEGRDAWRRVGALLGDRRSPRRRPFGGAAGELVVERLETRSHEGTVDRSALFRWTGAERRIGIATPPDLAGAESDASPFLPLAILPAMRRGDAVVIDGAVSGRLLRGAREAAELYHAWAPELRPPAIEVAEEREPEAASGRSIGLFFSRGLDSTYSAAVPRAYPGPIERLLFVRGLDPNMSPAVLAEEVRLATTVAEQVGLPLSVLTTNVHDLTRLFASNWEDVVGSALAAIALAATGGLHTVVVPSTNSTVGLGQNGSSPVLEPLLSSEATQVIHDSVALRRVGKAMWLARHRPDLLSELRVCYGAARSDNCGRCGKCLATMAALRAAGALEQARRFPALDLDLIRERRITLEPRIEYAELARVLEDGRDPELREAVLAALSQPMWTYPGPPMRQKTPGFRARQEGLVVSLARDGLPWPPAAPDAAPPGLGLLRAIDRRRGRHVYGIGRVPPGELVGELGSLPRDQTDGLEPVYITSSGHLVTEEPPPAAASARGLRTAARWAAAPLGWRGSGIAARTRVRAAADRGAQLILRRRSPSGEPLARVASIHVHPAPARLPLFSAVHPVTGDQLLTTDRLEAADLGYGDAELLGYLDPKAPVTGRLGTERRDVPWGSHLGRRTRSG
jgi:colanic acid/amylovoran biosynthesis protein